MAQGNKPQLLFIIKIMICVQLWLDSGADARQAKNFQNMKHAPLIKGDPETLILEHIAPPELHLMLGE